MQLTLSLKVGYAEVNCAIQQMHRSHSAYSQRTPLYPNNLLVTYFSKAIKPQGIWPS